MRSSIEHRNGKIEAFNPERIVTDCMKAGISEGIARAVAEDVSKKVYSNTPSHVLCGWVEASLESRSREAAALYRFYVQSKPRPAGKRACKHKRGWKRKQRKSCERKVREK